jgi:hypothetical protein
MEASTRPKLSHSVCRVLGGSDCGFGDHKLSPSNSKTKVWMMIMMMLRLFLFYRNWRVGFSNKQTKKILRIQTNLTICPQFQ